MCFLVRAVALVALVHAFAACDLFDDQVLCSQEDVSIWFRVVDSAGAPIDSLAITVTNVRTDEIYKVEQPYTDERGDYVALDDSFKGKVRSYGDPILVHGEQGAYRFEAAFIIGLSEHGCHVAKLAGPETVVIEDP
jgi:hypothetical protein